MTTFGERRIYPPAAFEKALINPLVNDLKIFESKQKLLMFAAALGAYREKQEKMTSRGEGIRIDIFQRAVDDTFIDALAVAVTNDLHVLASDRVNERAEIFERCVVAGLEEMAKIVERPVSTLEELIRLTQEASIQPVNELPGIDPSALAALENF